MHYAELELFKTMVVNPSQQLDEGEFNTDLIDHGIILDFIPTTEQEKHLCAFYQPLKLKTMFSLEERTNGDLRTMLVKQWTHYFITYGLGAGDVFDITFDGGEVVTVTRIRGVTKTQLGDMVRNKMYANAPANQLQSYQHMIDDYAITYEPSKIANNEMRVMLFDPAKHTLSNGDDVVRYMVYRATGDTMLIKSRQVIDHLRVNKSMFTNKFIEDNSKSLAQVFNRHKPLIMATKGMHNRSAINRVTRLSKTLHQPVHEPISKRFVAEHMRGNQVPCDKLTLRDKMKILNVIEWHMGGFATEMYQIRNGKAYTTNVKRNYNKQDLQTLQDTVLQSIRQDLQHLNGKNILLDANVDYGLPVSNKQTVGHVPFWTTVTVPDNARISSGIYWENSWGARDLDLSAIDLDGNRSGWGTLRGYSGSEPKYSGDVTNASSGAMEFMTSSTASYANYVNIFYGNNGSECEIVVGTEKKDRWINNVMARERIKLNSRQMIVGFTVGKKFVFYTGRYGNSRISHASNPVIDRMSCNMWTVRRVFDALGVKYVLDKDDQVVYDYDMTYSGFSYDKLEQMMGV